MMKITFVKATMKYKATIFSWLAQPHVQEFWDNSQAHKDDIINFMQGRKESSAYANGRYDYWVGLIDNVPYSLIMTIKENQGEERVQIKNDYLSTTGATYSIDFMIGAKEYLGKGLGARTLKEFMKFFQDEINNSADTFFIDPDVSNSRARHVYEQAGFKCIADFVMGGDSVFAGHKTHFMMKKIPLKPTVVTATLEDYPIIQNLARFYVYELSRFCGFISNEWACPADGLYADVDLQHYFKEPTRRAFLIKIGAELAGFVLLHQPEYSVEEHWVVAEFFILAKFQGQGIGAQVVRDIWTRYPGKWEVPIIPENSKALAFWRKQISNFTQGRFKEELKDVDYDQQQPRRYILSFERFE